MFRHVVLFRWKPAVSAEAVTAALAEVDAVLRQCETVRSFHVGRNAGSTSGNHDACVVADFDDEAGYLAYRDDPKHVALVEHTVKPLLDDRAALQYKPKTT